MPKGSGHGLNRCYLSHLVVSAYFNQNMYLKNNIVFFLSKRRSKHIGPRVSVYMFDLL